MVHRVWEHLTTDLYPEYLRIPTDQGKVKNAEERAGGQTDEWPHQLTRRSWVSPAVRSRQTLPQRALAMHWRERSSTMSGQGAAWGASHTAATPEERQPCAGAHTATLRLGHPRAREGPLDKSPGK